MDNHKTRTSFLRDNSFFSALSEEELNYVSEHSTELSFSKGEFLFREGDVHSDIYVLKEGVVEIRKQTEGTGELMFLGLLEEGAVIGELAYLDNSPRSVSIRATNSVEVIVISKEMTESESELTQSIQRKVLRTIALLSAQRLKDRTESHGDSLKKQIDLLQEQVHFGTLFVYMIILFGMNGFVLDIIQNHFGQYYSYDSPKFDLFYERIISWVGFIIFAFPVVILIRKIQFPIREILSVRKNLTRSVIEGLALSSVFVIPALLFTSGMVKIGSVPVANDKFTTYWLFATLTPDYLAHCYIQELVARGIMQNAVQRFLRDERGHKTILVSALAFGVMHAHMGMGAVIASAIGSLVFGYIYLRHKNLVGVTIIHYAGGVSQRLVMILGALS